ncbi:MAG: efflux RND transporter periplasmic adaptor subunit [Bacteroidales bacterium]|nr:efflux RND transporter periplasmic adaptor subunit [Bacteroidales bacterium]MCM1146350.1 efflux RND transporter periplasmic adaptor subunit [Bacteroidales bacterium]MCM1205212.1 efflux RND transporter periplasmic adaptor subunit [Bacillota bacterium]
MTACKKDKHETESSDYKTMTVAQENRTLRSEYTARLEGRQVVEVRPQVSGLITRICIGEGQKVRKGQTLFIIDQVPYKAALAEASANVKSAEAKLATARLNLESVRMLREKNVVQDYDLSVARNEYVAAKAALSQARAQEVNARNNLSYTEVKSPVDGVAGMIAYRVGALVSSGIQEPLVTVSDDSCMYAYFSLTESQVTNLMEQYGSLEEFIQKMAEVELRMSNGKAYSEKGRISAVSGIVTAGTGAVTLRADFPNPKSLLRGGGSATVIVPTVLTNAVVIPQSATYEFQNKKFVYKVVDGKAQSAPVTLYRLNNGTEYVVEDGLKAGEVIIAEGAGLVKEGAAVNPKNGKE